MDTFIENLHADEVRCGFFVTTYRKKLWNVQTQLIKEVERICRKYNLKYFAQCGTLLGAVRHQGFIPWDDDVDLAMPRPDYAKFIQVAPSELPPHYFLDLWENHRLAEEMPELSKEEKASDVLLSAVQSSDGKYPILSTEVTNMIREKHLYWPICAYYLKLRDSNTTMFTWKGRKNVNQGIFIDIFPIDPVPPFEDPKHSRAYLVGRELRRLASYSPKMREMLAANKKFLMPVKRVKQLLDMPFRDRALAHEEYMLNFYFEAPNMSVIRLFGNKRIYKPEFFAETVALPFEKTYINCPSMYEEALTAWYGDWRNPVVSKGHARKYSADIPYTDFFKSVTI